MVCHLTDQAVLNLVRCPACDGTFAHPWRCECCGHEYPATLGIPDLRWPQPQDSDQMRLIIHDLLMSFDKYSFDELCRIRLHRFVQAPDLEKHYLQYRLNQIDRGARMARMFQNRFNMHFRLERHDLALDIGCGVGAVALTYSQDFELVVGVDWNLADLILFRKSLDELGVSNVVLLQANLLHLPLVQNKFDYAVALNVIEHMIDVDQGFEEIARILRPGGGFCGDSRNRFDIFFPEPHVRLRMLGFLPRQSAIEYVRRRRGMSYEGTRLLSYWELDHLLAAHFRDYRIVYPEVSAYGASRRIDAWVRFFETKLALLSKLLLPFFTTMVAVGQK